MKNKLLLVLAALLLSVCSCVKDQELYDKVDNLDERVSALEEAVKELNQITIPGLQSIVAGIQGKIYVTSVTATADGYIITFSDSTTALIKNGAEGEKGDTPDVSIVEIEGEFYWAVDGQPLLDSKGNKIPVYQALPQLRISEGKWQVSYDGGTSWSDVTVLGNPVGSTISIEDGKTSVTFHINGESYTIQKEQPFYLVFNSRKDLGVPLETEYMFEYTISGMSDEDEIEVDILNCTDGWQARVISLPKGDVPGYIGVTNLENNSGKIFVYAANGRGKTDIKSLLFEEGVLTAEADVKSVPAAGGNVTISVTTNVGYELYVDRTQKWISVAPPTKATHTDVYTLVCEPNTTAGFRSAEVDIIDVQTGQVPSVFMILQYPVESMATDLASLAYVQNGTTVSLFSETVVASSENSAVVSDGTSNLYVVGAAEALPVGKVLNITGVKKANGDDYSYCLELVSSEVVAETSDVKAGEPSYIGVATSDEIPLYTSVSGILVKDGDSFVVTAPMGQTVIVEAPVAELSLDTKVGKTVTLYGYITSIHMEKDEEAETYTLIATDAKTVEFKENAAWTLSYSYDSTEDPDYPEVLTNTVVGSTTPYQLALYSAEKYNEIGLKDLILLSCDDLQYYLWFYNLMLEIPIPELFSMFAHPDGQTGSDRFEELEYGNYYAVAIGVNEDGSPTGDYKVMEFEKKEPTSVASYEDFIGRWKMGNEVLTVEALETGKTYSVTGIKNQAEYGIPAITAEFADGKFIIKECATGAEWNNGNYGVTDLYLSGVFQYGSGTYGAYPLNTDEPETILTAYVFEPGGKVTVKAGSCTEGGFIAMGFSWVIREGENAGRGNTFTGTTISDMSPVQDATPEYKAWLGNYVLNTKSMKTGRDTTYNVALTEGLPQETILVNGLGVDGFPLVYDAQSNTCSVVFGQFAANSSYVFYCSGITNEGYVCEGDPETGKIASLSKGADDVIKIENVVYSLGADRPEVYAEYWGILGVNATGGWFTFSDVNYIINPSTMTPAGATSSVKSVSCPAPAHAVNAEKAFERQNESIATYSPSRKIVDSRVAESGKSAVAKLLN